VDAKKSLSVGKHIPCRRLVEERVSDLYGKVIVYYSKVLGFIKRSERLRYSPAVKNQSLH
jgi:hypothetical protein